MKKFIYADNAATTKLDVEAFEAMKPYLLDCFANPSQPYSLSRKSKQALKQARKNIADAIGASESEIYFTSGGTESDNWAIKSIALNGKDGIILTSKVEHHAVLRSCESVAKQGCPVIYMTPDSEGVITLEILNKYINTNTKLVSVMLANNEVGSISPIRELAQIAHENGALFHTDAVQAVGHIKIDVKELGVDMLSASAHKFNGPKGVGFLYVKSGLTLNAFIDGGTQESGLRAGTENLANVVGMGVALRENVNALYEINKKLQAIEQSFFKVLDMQSIDYVRNGAKNHVPGNINISIAGANGESLLHRLDLKGIYISTGSACDSVNNQISHVIKAIGVPEKYAEGTIRITFGKDSTIEDAEIVASSIADILTEVR